MESSTDAFSPSPSQPSTWAAWMLLALGLAGHVYAAHAMGGSRIAYTHHVAGFFIILLVTGAVIVGLGWRFWRSHRAMAMLVVGVVQALIGLWIALTPYRSIVHS